MPLLADLYATPLSARASVLRDLWTRHDAPMTLASEDEWLEIYDGLGGFLLDAEVREDARPKNPLVLYRASSAAGVTGLSWTPFRRTAISYSRLRFGVPIWSAEVPPDRMRAAYPGLHWAGQWNEIVADVRGLAVAPVPALRRLTTIPNAARDSEDAKALAQALRRTGC
ncbi:hypothetical protein [Microbacterium tumbae]